MRTWSIYRNWDIIASFLAIIIVLIAFTLTYQSAARNSARPTSANYSDTTCSASGATARQVFVPHGAMANSNLDSTGAIQAAINRAAADGGGIVALPTGQFLLNGHLVLRSNVELAGSGPATVLKAGPDFLDSAGPDGGYPVVTTSGASNVTIANLTADQSGNVLNANTVIGRLSAYLIDIRDSHNAIVENIDTRNPFTYSIAVVASTDFCVTHSNTRGATGGQYQGLDGIHILDSNTGQVIGNNVDQRIGTEGDDGLVAHTINAPVYDVLYADNEVRGGNDGDGMQLAAGNYPIYNITIRGNDFYGSPFGIRTGYYETGSNGAVRNILIADNYIHALVPGTAFPDGGNAVDIGGFGAVAPVTNIMVTHNYICHAGAIIIASGAGNTASRNSSC